MLRILRLLAIVLAGSTMLIARPTPATAECGPDNCDLAWQGCDQAAWSDCIANQHTNGYQVVSSQCHYEPDPETGEPCFTDYSCGYYCSDSSGNPDCDDPWVGCSGGLCPEWCE